MCFYYKYIRLVGVDEPNRPISNLRRLLGTTLKPSLAA